MKKTLFFVGLGFLSLYSCNETATYKATTQASSCSTVQSYDIKQSHQDNYIFQELKTSIEKANQDCPIPFAGGIGQVSSIKVEDINISDADHCITYYIDFAPGQFNQSIKDNEESAKALFYLSIFSVNAPEGQTQAFVNNLQKQRVALKVVINKNKIDEFTTILSPSYLQAMSSKGDKQTSESLHEGLQLLFELGEQKFPLKIDEGLVATGMKVKGSNIIYDIICDEQLYDIENIRNSSDILAHEMINASKGDPSMCAILDLCKVSNTGMIYQYKGKQSGNTASIVLSNKLIRNLHKTPSQIHIY